jgi:hypothetical protein
VNNTCVCNPATCASLGNYTCGDWSDNCGGTVHCGTCTSPQTCGGGSSPFHCGCTPTTCAQVFGDAQCTPTNATSAQLDDHCGGTVSCGTCATGRICTDQEPGHLNHWVCCLPTFTMAMCPTFGGGKFADGCGGIVDCGGG